MKIRNMWKNEVQLHSLTQIRQLSRPGHRWCMWVCKYLFIAVSQHIPHTVHQKGELRPLLKLLIPALLHNIITTTWKTYTWVYFLVLMLSKKSYFKDNMMTKWQRDSHFIRGMGRFGHSVASLQSAVEQLIHGQIRVGGSSCRKHFNNSKADLEIRSHAQATNLN